MVTFVDDLYEAYKHQLSDDELNVELLAASVLDELNREDVLSLMQELSDEEVFGLFGVYLIENLKQRLRREKIHLHPLMSAPPPRMIH